MWILEFVLLSLCFMYLQDGVLHASLIICHARGKKIVWNA